MRHNFEPPTRRPNPPVASTLVLLAAIPLLLTACSENRNALPLHDTVSSPVAGLPFAQRIQAQVGPGYFLHSILVVWERERADFNVRKISYRFSAPGGGPLLAVSLDNVRHLAYLEPNPPTSSDIVGLDTLPVDLNGRTMQDILQIALDNGLGAFCSGVPPGKETILFLLQSHDRGPLWHITGDGTDDNGAVAQLRLDIDAGSGAVLSRNFRKTATPPAPH